jgi:hypothetical protein
VPWIESILKPQGIQFSFSEGFIACNVSVSPPTKVRTAVNLLKEDALKTGRYFRPYELLQDPVAKDSGAMLDWNTNIVYVADEARTITLAVEGRWTEAGELVVTIIAKNLSPEKQPMLPITRNNLRLEYLLSSDPVTARHDLAYSHINHVHAPAYAEGDLLWLPPGQSLSATFLIDDLRKDLRDKDLLIHATYRQSFYRSPKASETLLYDSPWSRFPSGK